MDDDIENYIDFFRAQVDEIQRLDNRLYKKILSVTAIDALSRGIYPNIQVHRDRVLKLLRTCSGWEDINRVSAFHLRLALEDNGQAAGQLYQEVVRVTESWAEGAVIQPDADPEFAALEKIADPSNLELCKSARYGELFYTYRNHLVHEFREPGYGMELSDDPSSPYYHSMKGSPWEMVFPVAFFLAMCRKCIEGAGVLMRENGINPYGSYEFGTMWRKKRRKAQP